MSTPMFQQYHALKEANPHAILFFRMGDFYEMFFDDAIVAARELDLTLTARNKHAPDPVPMAGVPHHASAAYIEKLVAKGHRVAIAEQVEDPRQAKGLVKREVIRVVSPGVVLDPTSLAHQRPNYLVGVCCDEDGGWGVAFLDISTGDFRLTDVPDVTTVVAEIHRLEPREALIAPGIQSSALDRALRGVVRSRLEDAGWSRDEALRELRETLAVHSLEGFGVDEGASAVRAAGALLRYARDQLGGPLRNIHELRAYEVSGFMVLDDTTRRNLELTRTLIGGRRKGSLLSLIDRTATSMGSRLMRDWVVFPLLDPEAIRGRSAGVAALVDTSDTRESLRLALREVADIERIGARVVQQTAHARDLAALSRSLQAAPRVAALAAQIPAVAAHLPTDLCADIALDLSTWLVDEPPISLTEGGLLRANAHAELDELVEISLEGVGIIGRLEDRERAQTGISSLKIRRNKVFGYYIEVTRAHVHKVPEHYLRKQTLSNCERYITPELKELEEKVLGADERRKDLEYSLFIALRARVAEHSARMISLAKRLAALDALCALAEVAVTYRWCRPEVEASTRLEIDAGRHPVVEQTLEEERFVPNDLSLDTTERQLIILTGPNMSGKSTIMRQAALIALLAQMGSFVPARSATVGICDRIFTRVGAADDLVRGQSTFMVEMAETAAILHQASARSLVILDEIGRGTSTYDGLAIAWSVAEDLVDRVGCRTLFATHYHELCDLVETRAGVVNQSVAVSEYGEEIVFLRKLKEGGASRSYGIQCARLAGLPKHVIQRATRLLARFEKHAPRNEREQLSLFGAVGAPPAVEPTPPPRADDALRRALEAIDPDGLTPRQALDALYALRALAREHD